MHKTIVDKKCGRWILVATILASGMSFMAGSAVNIALPTIQAEFNVNLFDLQNG